MNNNLFYIGIDPGRSKSYFGLVICEWQRDRYTGQQCLHLIHVFRYPLGTPILEVIKALEKLSYDERFGYLAPVFVLDCSGPGGSLCLEEMRDKNIIPIIDLTVISRGASTKTRVKKEDLIENLVNFIRESRLKIPQSLPRRELLLKELRDYRAELSSNGSVRKYKSINGGSDDLLDALALVCYAAPRWEPTWCREPEGMSEDSKRRRPVSNRQNFYGGNIQNSIYAQLNEEYARSRGFR